MSHAISSTIIYNMPPTVSLTVMYNVHHTINIICLILLL